tara:strand:+ start:5318 stop:5455 length:138 start_codon:yes stop_codon:yes gene_type:complete
VTALWATARRLLGLAALLAEEQTKHIRHIYFNINKRKKIKLNSKN